MGYDASEFDDGGITGNPRRGPRGVVNATPL